MKSELEELVSEFQELGKDKDQFLIDIRRHLHQYPELGFQEFKTSAFVRQVLEANGLDVKGPIAETGLYTDIIGDRPGPMIAYRADMDALPIQDQKDVDYASKNEGVAHLCGHDYHTTVAIGVALELHKKRSELRGGVRVFFQPNEEGMPSGAPAMIRDGVLEGISAAYAIHVWPTMEVGHYGTVDGAITAACDSFLISVSMDSTGHSARPHATSDPIFVSSKLMGELYQLPGRINDARNAAVITLCKIEGGSALNVIPKEVHFGGTLRCLKREDQVLIRSKIEELCHHFSKLYNVSIKYDLLNGAPPCDCDSKVVQHINQTIREFRGEDTVENLQCSMGAEDFSHYLQVVPGALMRVGTSNGPSTSFPLHDARFDLAEESISMTVETISRVLQRHLDEFEKFA